MASIKGINRGFESTAPTVNSGKTKMQINIADSWKEIQGMQIKIGDVSKEIISAKINIGDAWKEIF